MRTREELEAIICTCGTGQKYLDFDHHYFNCPVLDLPPVTNQLLKENK